MLLQPCGPWHGGLVCLFLRATRIGPNRNGQLGSCLTASPRSGDFLRPVSLCGCDYSLVVRWSAVLVRRGRVWLSARNWRQSRSPRPVSSVIPRPWRSKLKIGLAVIGNLSNDPRSHAVVGTRPDKATRRAGTFLNQRRAGNEIILKECIQYSVPIPRPNLRILASHSIGAVQVRESGCLAVCTTVRPINLGKHLNPSRPTFDFVQSSGANGLQEHRHYGSCYGTLPG